MIINIQPVNLQLFLNVLDNAAAQMIDGEMRRIFEKQDALLTENKSKRSAAVNEALKEILTRRIGSSALKNVVDHLTAQRDTSENIPYIRILHEDLENGQDADTYAFLEFVPVTADLSDAINYELVFRGTEGWSPGEDTGWSPERDQEGGIVDDTGTEPSRPGDWTRDLFAMPEPADQYRPKVVEPFLLMDKTQIASAQRKLASAESRQGPQEPAAAQGGDEAMLSKNVGGIDLNPNAFTLESTGEASGLYLPMDPQRLEQFKRVEGFYPFILNIAPVTNLPILLGVAEDKNPIQISHRQGSD